MTAQRTALSQLCLCSSAAGTWGVSGLLVTGSYRAQNVLFADITEHETPFFIAFSHYSRTPASYACQVLIASINYHRTPTEHTATWSDDTTTRRNTGCTAPSASPHYTLTRRPHRSRNIAIGLHDPLDCCAKFPNSSQKYKVCRRIMWQRLSVLRFTFPDLTAA